MNKEVWKLMSDKEKFAYMKGVQETLNEVDDYIYETICFDDKADEKLKMIHGYVEGLRRGIENEIIRN